MSCLLLYVFSSPIYLSVTKRRAANLYFVDLDGHLNKTEFEFEFEP